MQVFLNIWHHCNQLSTFFRLTLFDRLHYLQNSFGTFPEPPELLEWKDFFQEKLIEILSPDFVLIVEPHQQLLLFVLQ